MKNNIVLIGMPGSGKTTLAQKLARLLEMEVVDMDERIVHETGRSIADLFAEGESYFRQIEAQLAGLLAKKDHTIISTGGGIVGQAQAMKDLKEKGIVVFIDRPLDQIEADIDRSSRPLLASEQAQLTDLYHERIDLYRHYSDLLIANDKDMDKVLKDLKQACLQALEGGD